jgi:hypothetical protein
VINWGGVIAGAALLAFGVSCIVARKSIAANGSDYVDRLNQPGYDGPRPTGRIPIRTPLAALLIGIGASVLGLGVILSNLRVL